MLNFETTSYSQLSSVWFSYASNIVNKYVYGHDQPMDTEDPLVALFDEEMERFNIHIFSKLFLVDVIPLCERFLLHPVDVALITHVHT